MSSSFGKFDPQTLFDVYHRHSFKLKKNLILSLPFQNSLPLRFIVSFILALKTRKKLVKRQKLTVPEEPPRSIEISLNKLKKKAK